MRNKILSVILIGALMIPVGLVWAQHGSHGAVAPKAGEVGNKFCPVSGEKVQSMGGAIKHVYKGKTYNLCCPMCIEMFNKDPQKFSRIAQKEVQEGKTDHKAENHEHPMEPVMDSKGEISHYTCGMHPSVKVPVESYDRGDTKCPICFMLLTPVRKEAITIGDNENVVSKVAIQARELTLAGVQTEPAQRRQLFKEIRAVGQVAYDPQLAVAQDELISASRSLERAQQGGLSEVVGRAESLVESSKRKLRLLGLNNDQIEELEKTKKVQENLVLPEDKMWIYGDVYEHELDWVKEGAHVKVVPVGLAGEEFYGEIVSINPVIDAQTRSVRFRALVDNPGQRLRPQMYTDVEIMSQYLGSTGREEVLAIPKSALLDTGRRRIVWVDKGNGDFEGRRIEVGPEMIDHSGDPRKFYPVLKGIAEGEKVVTKGNFLIDSQSQITGVASSAYGGALAGEEKPAQPKGAKGSKGSHSGHGH